MQKKAINQLKLNFPSLSENERFARIAVSGFLSQLNPLVDELAEIKTAVSEGVTNCIVHAYKDTVGIIYIEVKIFENSRVYIKIRDKGCGIENISRAMEPLFTTSPEEERAGLGFSVMESFMDTVKVKSAVGKGTTLVMEKTLKSRKALY
ncbi:MAG: anti-sigma F factor [Oscillospiraceae bacterium]